MQPASVESPDRLTRAEQNRINAQNSTGPRTAEGKQRSALNAVKHGYYSNHVVLPGESTEEFVKLRQSYIDQFRPTGQLETDLIQDLADARWRICRMKRQETLEWSQATFDVSHDPQLANVPYEVLHEFAHRQCCQTKGNPLEVCRRAEARFRRDFDRALKLLHEHRRRKACTDRQEAQSPQPEKSQNEATAPQPETPPSPKKSPNEPIHPDPPPAQPPQSAREFPSPAEVEALIKHLMRSSG
ncbi:MAG: hypothetical protein JNK48_17590 [Bryobacterales bacterium]|nr:hypothetical protein [Bryobacterales bacterium]